MRTIAVALVAGSLLATAPPARAQDVAAGAAVYGRQCGRCHAPRAADEYTDRAWNVVMQHMRIIAVLSARETREVLAFLQASNRDGPAVAAGTEAAEAGRAEPAADGRTLVEQYGCRGCHTIGGGGGALAPALDGIGSRRSADYIARKLQNPRFDNAQSIMPALPLSDAERAAMVAFLLTLR